MQIEDNAQVRLPPPLVYLGMLLLGFGIGALIGQPAIGLDRVTSGVLGGLLVIAGFALTVRAVGLFRQAGTNPQPWLPANAIVTSGVYRWTRNPMYLGMALIFAGLAIVFDSLAALLMLPIAVAVIQTQVIAREERYLETKFGDPYLAYKQQVRRWL